MTPIFYLLLGLAFGALGMYFFGNRRREEGAKAANKNKIIGLLATRERITNSDVREALGVSDATVTRYLDELEKEGAVRQVGDAGKYVYYERV